MIAEKCSCMKFRFYQLLYVATLVLIVLALVEPVASFTSTEGALSVMSNFKYTDLATGNTSYSVVALGVVLIFTGIVSLLSLFLSFYSNFELQKRTTILTMLLFAGYYILFLVYTLVLSDGASLNLDVPMLYPFFGITLNLFAFLLVRRQEAKIIAKALGFRLRD